MAVQLPLDGKKAAYIPESDSWMYEPNDKVLQKPRKHLMAGLDRQQRICGELVGRIERGLPCNIAVSIQNLQTSILAFNRDIAICKAWTLHRKGPVNPPFFEKYKALMEGVAAFEDEQSRHIEALLIEDASSLVELLRIQCSQIHFSSLEKSLHDMQRQHLQSQNAQKRNLMIAVTVIVIAIFCAKLI